MQLDYLPIVVARDDLNDYVDAADAGDLNRLMEFTARLHHRSILQIMSVCSRPTSVDVKAPRRW